MSLQCPGCNDHLPCLRCGYIGPVNRAWMRTYDYYIWLPTYERACERLLSANDTPPPTGSKTQGQT